MSVIIQGSQLREIALGRYTQGKTSTITADATYQIFTVAGGEVLITALWGVVTTAITDDGEDLAIVLDPTTGDSTTIVTATDLSTTDTAIGTVLGFKDQGDGTIDFQKNGGPLPPHVVTTGEVELLVSAGTGSEDGVIDWYCTWVPLTPGATVTASA